MDSLETAFKLGFAKEAQEDSDEEKDYLKPITGVSEEEVKEHIEEDVDPKNLAGLAGVVGGSALGGGAAMRMSRGKNKWLRAGSTLAGLLGGGAAGGYASRKATEQINKNE